MNCKYGRVLLCKSSRVAGHLASFRHRPAAKSASCHRPRRAGLPAGAAFVPGDYVAANPGRRTGVAPVSDFEFLAWNEHFSDLIPTRLKLDPFFKDGDRRDAGPTSVAARMAAV